MARPPKPDTDLVNLGAIIDQPFLFQAGNPSSIRVPGALASVTRSTAIPGGTAEGATTYSYGPAMELIRDVQVTDGGTKSTEYLYSAPDPAELLSALESKAASQAERVAALSAQDPRPGEQLNAAKTRLATTREKISTIRKLGSDVPARMVATTWVEIGEGSLMVRGETRFEYDGTDIVSALTTVKTMEVPPRIDELKSEFRYNDLGQVSEIDESGSITHCEYDALGRLAAKRGGYVSSSGDFLADHKTVFTYSPPTGDPNQVPPPNALLSSVNDSVSGSPAPFEENPRPLDALAVKGPSASGDASDGGAHSSEGWLKKLIGGDASTSQVEAPDAPAPIDLGRLEGDFDTTNVVSTYSYP